MKPNELFGFILEIYGGSSSTKVTFEGYSASNSRFFLDNVIVKEGTNLPAEAQFKFSETTVAAALGHDFTAPTLTNTYGTTATYSSSNTSVATVDVSTGAVTLVAAGETTITATDGTNTASYTLTVITLTGEGTFSNPYTTSDVKAMKEESLYPNEAVWVKGYIVGSFANGLSSKLAETDVDTNIALAETTDATTDFISVQLDKGNLRTITELVTNAGNKGKQVYVYGIPQDYMSIAGIKSVSKISGLNQIEVKTVEGYATFYTNCAFEMPEGLQGGIVTATDTENGTLTISYDYEASATVPAKTGLLIKGTTGTYSVVNTSSSAKSPDTNKLSGSVADEETTGGDKYYMLSYESEEHKSLGFYWGEENGAAFTNGAHRAYLALTSTEASGNAKGFALDGSTTGIRQIGNGAVAGDAVYTVDGRRVADSANLKRGLYIRNGRKFVVK